MGTSLEWVRRFDRPKGARCRLVKPESAKKIGTAAHCGWMFSGDRFDQQAAPTLERSRLEIVIDKGPTDDTVGSHFQ